MMDGLLVDAVAPIGVTKKRQGMLTQTRAQKRCGVDPTCVSFTFTIYPTLS